MDYNEVTAWQIELNDTEEVADSVAAVMQILTMAQSIATGRIVISYDNGPRPWWHRLLGSGRRYIAGFVYIQWAEEYANLMFHDENWSEYRALDPAHPVSANDKIRSKISQDGATPFAAEECLEKTRAFAAVRETLQSGNRPSWLSYQFAK